MTTPKVANAALPAPVRVEDEASREITMTVSPQMLAVIEQLGRDSGQPLELVFEQAIALYRAALRVASEGKHLGYATSADALEVEFTDLIAPRG